MKEAGKRLMVAADLAYIQEKLLEQRRNILEHLQKRESDWHDLAERDVEQEEEAQKADLAYLLSELSEREWQEIEDIDLALGKIENNSYGVCERCGKSISAKRLEALPTTRFCRECVERKDTG